VHFELAVQVHPLACEAVVGHPLRQIHRTGARSLFCISFGQTFADLCFHNYYLDDNIIMIKINSPWLPIWVGRCSVLAVQHLQAVALLVRWTYVFLKRGSCLFDRVLLLDFWSFLRPWLTISGRFLLFWAKMLHRDRSCSQTFPLIVLSILIYSTFGAFLNSIWSLLHPDFASLGQFSCSWCLTCEVSHKLAHSNAFSAWLFSKFHWFLASIDIQDVGASS